MKTLQLEIFTYIYDDDFHKVIETKHKYFATYVGDIDVSKVEQDLYSLLGEGIRVSTNHNELYSIISIDLLGDRPIDNLVDYLSKYKIIDNDIDIYEPFSNTDFEEYIQFNTSYSYLNDEELKNVKEILNEAVVEYKIISGNEIYEKGASSYWTTYLIAVAGGLTVQLTMRLFDAIKSKVFDKEDINTIKIQLDIKNKLLNEYNLKPSQIYLSRFDDKSDDGIIELTYRTKNDEFRIQADNKGNVVKLRKFEKKQK
jgi:hypothetical protein